MSQRTMPRKQWNWLTLLAEIFKHNQYQFIPLKHLEKLHAQKTPLMK